MHSIHKLMLPVALVFCFVVTVRIGLKFQIFTKHTSKTAKIHLTLNGELKNL